MIDVSKVKYDGVKVKIGDQELIVPSLTVKQARSVWPEILEMDKQGVTLDTVPLQWDRGVKVIHTALSRNYPELTTDQLEEMLELRDWAKLIKIVSGQSGMLPGETVPVVAAPAAVIQ